MDNAAVLGRYQPLKIVMCKEGELAKSQIKHYNIGVEAIEESYRKKINLLEKDNKEKEELVRSLSERHRIQLYEKASILYYLQKEKEEALANVRYYSNLFAEINLDDADSLYIAAYEAYMDKRIEDVYRILDLSLLEENMNKAKAEIKAGESMIAYADSVQNYNLAMLEKYVQSGWLAADASTKTNALQQAQRYYKQAIQANPNHLELRYAYAQFLADYLHDITAYIDNLEQAIAIIEQAEPNQTIQKITDLLCQHLSVEPHFLSDMPYRMVLLKKLQSLNH